MPYRHLCFISAAAALLAAATAAPALALGDGPAIASDWADLTVPQGDCFPLGEVAIQRMGFGEIERTKYSRFGTRDDYTVSVRCIEEKGLVLAPPPAGTASKPTRSSSIF